MGMGFSITSNSEIVCLVDILKWISVNIWCENAELDHNYSRKVKFKLCNMMFNSGVYRTTQHVTCIRGNMAPHENKLRLIKLSVNKQ